MAGYGNRTAPDLNPEDLSHHHDNTRLGRDDSHPYSGGHETYGSGATGGAGFGNKSAPDPEDLTEQHSNTRFGSHQDTKPYSGSTEHGSGTTGGAGFGNKTGGFEKKDDSTMGKLMEKAGTTFKNEGLVNKGHAKREAAGFGQEET